MKHLTGPWGSAINKLFIILLLCVPILSVGRVVVTSSGGYFWPDYNDGIYTQLENLFNNSQYRLKNPTSIIADEIVFRYAAGAYMRGVDPILINSEHTPLGKYMIGASYVLFKTDTPLILLSGVAVLAAIWWLGRLVLGNTTQALVPVALFSVEPLFVNQFRFVPLLDIIQLPFILLSLVVFYLETKKKYFWATMILVGLVAATKSIVPAVLLSICFLFYLLLARDYKRIKIFIVMSPLSVGVFTLSYLRTFLNGYSLSDFVGFQKWIFLYQQSKLILPLSFWRLVMLNEWQTWWGDQSLQTSNDWTIVWPLLMILPFVFVILSYFRKFTMPGLVRLLLLWILVYEAFLSVGAVVTRFLLPLLPILYIVGIYTVREMFLSRKSL